MLLVIICGLAALLGLAALVTSFKNKNFLGFIFAGGTATVFGWFAIMTLLNSGFPVAH